VERAAPSSCKAVAQLIAAYNRNTSYRTAGSPFGPFLLERAGPIRIEVCYNRVTFRTITHLLIAKYESVNDKTIQVYLTFDEIVED